MRLSVLCLYGVTTTMLLRYTKVVSVFHVLPVARLVVLIGMVCAMALVHCRSVGLRGRTTERFGCPVCLIVTLNTTRLVTCCVQRFRRASVFLPLKAVLFVLLLI